MTTAHTVLHVTATLRSGGGPSHGHREGCTCALNRGDGVLSEAFSPTSHRCRFYFTVYQIAAGDQVILEIDVQGGFQIKEKVPSAHLVFIEPPSLEELERRLRGRATETEESIELRMKNAELELSRKMEYDIQFVNDNLDVCTDELVAYIERQAEN